MTPENLKIKEEVNEIYQKINLLHDQLDIIRNQVCNHEETNLCNYMERPGRIIPDTIVCSICGKTIRRNEI